MTTPSLPQIKITELPEIPAFDDNDIFVTVDTSDASVSIFGRTKKGTFGQIKQNILNSVALPKATTLNSGVVTVGSGLNIDSNGVLRADFSGLYDDLTNKPALISSITELEDVGVIQPSEGDFLIYAQQSGTLRVVNRKISFNDLGDIPTNIVLENSDTTLESLTITGNLIVTGTTVSNNFDTLNVGTSQVILNDLLGKFTGDIEGGSSVITNIPDTSLLEENAEVSIVSNGGDLIIAPGTIIQAIVTQNSVLLSNEIQGIGTSTDVVFSSPTTPLSNASISVNRSEETNAEIRWNEQNNIWEFNNGDSDYHPLPTPAAYGDFNNLLNKPSIPLKTSDFSDISNDEPAVDAPYLRWNGNFYEPSAIQSDDLSKISINALKDVDTSNPPTQGQVLKWTGTAWAPSSDLVGGLSVDGAIVTSKETSSIIPFYHATFDAFPSPSDYEGAIAYTKSGGKIYYAHGTQWLELALAKNVQANTDTTYSISGVAPIQTDLNQRHIDLKSSIGDDGDSRVTLRGSGGVNISNVNNDSNTILISSRTYSISTGEEEGENDSAIVLNDSASGTSKIVLKGADGLVVERDQDGALVFRAPADVIQYTDSMAKDAAAAMITNGTHLGISWNYDSTNKQLSSTVSGGGDGTSGTAVLYDLGISSTTTNQAIISLTNNAGGQPDTFTFIGEGGTQVTWDSKEKNILISSTAPVQADWDATEGLSQILNKPVIPPEYVLPTATQQILGGVKVDGSTITISNGVISAASGGYVLPKASASTLGGIKIGSGLSIDGDGIVTVAQGDGGIPLQTRTTISGTTASLNFGEYEELTLGNGYRAYFIFKIETSAEAWIRVYTDLLSMVKDRTRSEGNDPVAGSGVIAEVRVDGSQILTPVPTGFNNDSPLSNNIYVSVTNRSIIPSEIQVSLTILRLEA